MKKLIEMKKKLLPGTLGMFLIFSAWMSGELHAVGDSGAKEDIRESYKNVNLLRQEISSINLLNGLYLTKDQMKEILSLAGDLRKDREEMIRSAEFKTTLKETEKLLKKLRNEIQKGSPARGELPREAHRADHHLKEMRKERNISLSKKLKEYDVKLRSILTDEQIGVVNSFKPCLIPPKNLRDPVRAGQASDNMGAIKRLRRLRDLPDEIWEKRKDRIISRMLDRYSKRKYEMTGEEKLQEKNRLIALFEQVRSMSETEFELEKEALAENIRPEDKIEGLVKELEFRKPGHGRPKMTRPVRFLLNDHIILILEERLEGKQGV